MGAALCVIMSMRATVMNVDLIHKEYLLSLGDLKRPGKI